jgi:hypothetical protein
MDAISVRENIIRPKLKESFGEALTNMLLNKAVAAAYSGDNPVKKLELMINAICSDQAVIDMLGQAQLEKLKKEWMASLG